MHAVKRIGTLIITLIAVMTVASQELTSIASTQQELTSDTIVQQKLEALGVTFTDGNSVRLLDSGQKKFSAMLDSIRHAKHYVHLEYFNFRNDSLGRVLFTLLGEKAREGVKVRAMFDSFGNRSNDSPLKPEHIKLIREAGIDIYEFDPIKFPWINHAYHRDHRKIVVIDGAVAYAGGMNVADYYIHGRPEFGAWRDMHMELHGPVVAQYEQVFERMWWQVTGEVIMEGAHEAYKAREAIGGLRAIKAHRLNRAKANKAAESNEPLSAGSLGGSQGEMDALHQRLERPSEGIDATVTDARIGVVDRRPHRYSKLMRKAYVAAIDAAQQHIQIINPYPTNVKSVRRAIKRALKRGVDVEIMVSAKSDVPITPDVVGLEMKHMAKRGARVWYNNDGFHHSKVMMVDGRFCTVGSTNLDARSFLYDYEVNAFILNSQTTGELNAHFEKEKKNCEPYRNEDWRKRFSLGHRLVGRMFSLVKGFF